MFRFAPKNVTTRGQCKTANLVIKNDDCDDDDSANGDDCHDDDDD